MHNLFDLPFVSEQSFSPQRDNSGLYETLDHMSAEREVFEFLHGLARIVKPKLVLETGTWFGYSTLYLAHALKENGIGRLITIEQNIGHIEKARELWSKHGLSDTIESVCADSTQYLPPDPVDLCYLDCEHHIRIPIFKRLVKLGKIANNGLVVLHDTNHNPLDKQILELPFDRLTFNSPRGLTVFQIREDNCGQN